MRLHEITVDPRIISSVSNIDADANKMIEAVKIECSDAILAAAKNRLIFKGMFITGLPLLIKTNPALIERKSQNTANHYTVLLSNLPEWKRFPKRSRSLICSTSYKYAAEYGSSTFLVLPKNGTKIGVCSQRDFWESFPVMQRLSNLVSGRFHNMDQFTEFLAEECDIPDTLPYDKMIARMLEKKQTLANCFPLMATAETTRDIRTELGKILNPKQNEFRLSTINTIPPTNITREVWFSDEAYLLNTDDSLFLEVLEKLHIPTNIISSKWYK